MMKTYFFLLMLLLFQPFHTIFAQGVPVPTRDGIYVIFDASNSMWGELEIGGARKIEVAKDVLGDFVAGDFSNRDVALRIYGRNQAADCSDTELVAPFGSSEVHLETIRNEVQASTPRGKTPISRSLTAALEDFGERQGDILLISDGIETCDLDPCDLMAQWKESGIDIRVHVVGFGLDDIARSAMQCVADTSGGGYFDADSPGELALALDQARETAIDSAPILPRESNPQSDELGYALMIIATDAEGVRYRTAVGEAMLMGSNGERGEPFEINTSERYPVTGPGTYSINLGVMMKTGEIYQPVSTQAIVANKGDTVINIIVEKPPSVSARFVVGAEDTTGSQVTAFRDGEEVFSFRSFDEVFVPEGSYEFRSNINQDNDLAVTAVLRHGEHTLVNFELVSTVRAYIRFVTPDGENLRRNAELWRNGEVVYKVHASNGAEIVPGEYELHASNRATPLLPTMIVVPDEEDTVITVPLDVGWVVVSYDPTGTYAITPNRAFLEGVSDTALDAYAQLNTPIMLQPGIWRVEGWSQAGDFAGLEVDVISGEVVEVMLTPR